MKLFKDRHQAGELLAEKLSAMRLDGEICVLALPRGGVPVAWEVSQALKCPLDMLFIKKIGAPGQQELAIGAIAEGSEVHWQKETIDWLGISNAQLKEMVSSKKLELQNQIKKLRKGRPALDVKGKTAIVVDDGLATGSTMIAALQFLRKKSPRRVVVAIPVASESAVAAVAPWCDDVIVLEVPTRFFGVGQWYQDFTQVRDDDVRKLLDVEVTSAMTGTKLERLINFTKNIGVVLADLFRSRARGPVRANAGLNRSDAATD
jgi:putative phosphoribosyl transferase